MLKTNQIENITDLLKEVGHFQKQEQHKIGQIEVHEKGLNQLVSYVDIESEKALVKGLSEITKGCSFITEEDTVSAAQSDSRWIIDPLDGTTNFLFGHNQFAISIAYQVRSETKAGFIYVPQESDLYLATPDGAFLNGINIHVSKRTSLKESLIATGFPYYEFRELDEYLDVLKVLMKETKGLRRMGSAAIDLALTAQGNFDGFFELNLSPWDVAAGAYLVQQAGGQVSDFSNGINYVFGNSIIAGNSSIHTALLYEIQSSFKAFRK